MTIREKIKTIDNKTERNKTHFSIDKKKTTKISALSSRNIGKYEFLIGKDILPEECLLEKADTIKRFEYSTLGSKLEKQTDMVKNQNNFFKD